MYPSVRSYFNGFTKTFEGRVPWMYLDVKGLVTIAIGNLIDPVEEALSLKFVHKRDQTPATQDQIRAEWSMLKAKTDLAHLGYTHCEAITSLRLTDRAIDDLLMRKLDQNEATLAKVFHDWNAWPADAQLAVHSMAWAMGPNFPASWPHFSAACKAHDWSTAAAQCKMDETGNPGLVPRNVANAKLLHNAAVVKAKGLDKTKVYYPKAAA